MIWNKGECAKLRSGWMSSTSCSKGICWCSYAANAFCFDWASSSRYVGLSLKSLRKTNVLAKKPILFTTSTCSRLAIGVPMTISFSPLRRPTKVENAAWIAIKGVTPWFWQSCVNWLKIFGGSLPTNNSPANFCSGGRGKSSGKRWTMGSDCSSCCQYKRSFSIFSPASHVLCQTA